MRAGVVESVWGGGVVWRWLGDGLERGSVELYEQPRTLFVLRGAGVKCTCINCPKLARPIFC